MENKMKYIINYTEQGKILGFAKGDSDLNIEVSNAKWVEGQSYNKIIVDGDNISFDKVDWRTPEEIRTVEINTQISEAKSYLSDTGWYIERLNDPSSGKAIPEEVLAKRAEVRELINTLEAELGGL